MMTIRRRYFGVSALFVVLFLLLPSVTVVTGFRKLPHYWTFRDASSRMEWTPLSVEINLQKIIINTNNNQRQQQQQSVLSINSCDYYDAVVIGMSSNETETNNTSDGDDDNDTSLSTASTSTSPAVNLTECHDLQTWLEPPSTTDNNSNGVDGTAHTSSLMTTRLLQAQVEAHNLTKTGSSRLIHALTTVKPLHTAAATTTTLDNTIDKPKAYLLMGMGRTNQDARTLGSLLAQQLLALFPKAKPQLRRKNDPPPHRVALVLLSDLERGSKESKEYLKQLLTSLLNDMYRDVRFQSATLSSNTIPKICVDVLVSVNGDKDDDIVEEETRHMDELQDSIEAAKAQAKATYLCKDIVSAPHNALNSIALAHTAQRLAKKNRRSLTCRILNQDDCQRLGMGAFLGVARGSETPGRFIHLTYQPAGMSLQKRRRLPTFGLVGKGLLFDTGGYNIKTGMMELMKFDCGGAAAVLGSLIAICHYQPECVVHVLVPACENMINERSMVPGDILQAMNGRTIEIQNTDAEGRLALADALVYADTHLHCDGGILELSTLTGACMISLGTSLAGVWSRQDDFASELVDVGRSVGQRVWHMPLENSYRTALDSRVADITNLSPSSRYGGAIHAALFLHEFVRTATPYMHVDMAGTVWNAGKRAPTGYGPLLVTEWVRKRAEAASEPPTS